MYQINQVSIRGDTKATYVLHSILNLRKHCCTVSIKLTFKTIAY